MRFTQEKIKDIYLHDARVETIFINEYLPGAPGDFVKVYIYGLMYAQFGIQVSDKIMSKELGMNDKKIADAWTYWEKLGVIRKNYMDAADGISFSVEFLELKAEMYGKSREPLRTESETVEGLAFDSEATKKTFDEIEKILARTLSSTEVRRILKWLVDEKIPAEMVLFCVNYCSEKNKTSLNYMESVLHNWADRGLNTVDGVNRYLQEVDQRFYQRRRIFDALGFRRNPTEAETKIMDRWIDELGFNIDTILEACSRTVSISNPNIKYVNSILENWTDEAKRSDSDPNKRDHVTKSQLKRYYEYLRNKAEQEASIRTEEVYDALPRVMDIDSKLSDLGAQMSRSLLKKGRDQSKDLSEQMKSLAMERALLLTDNGFERDYTDIHYGCSKCNDTGMTDDGHRCECVAGRMEEAEIWLKSKADVK